MLTIRTLPPQSFPLVAEFYGANDYHQSVDVTDTFIVAQQDELLIGALRLCLEQHVLVLRGMRVDAGWRKKGVGRALLQHAVGEIGERACYCIPFRYLEKFYAQAGFQPLDPADAPAFLRQRLEAYLARLHLDVILMVRPPAAAG